MPGADLTNANTTGAKMGLNKYCNTTMPDGGVKNDNC